MQPFFFYFVLAVLWAGAVSEKTAKVLSRNFITFLWPKSRGFFAVGRLRTHSKSCCLSSSFRLNCALAMFYDGNVLTLIRRL